MNLISSPLRKAASVAATASIVATSLVTVVAPTVAPAITTAATTCVQEQGSTTVYPALAQAQPGYQAAVGAQPAWPTGQTLGCDSTLVANGSGTGKSALINYYNGSSSTAIDMAASSAPLASGSEQTNLMAFQVGGDAMVIAVQDANPMTQITMGQVTAIYNGNVSTFQQLGTNANGATGTIVPRSRIIGSGTRDDMNRLFKMDRGAGNTGPACSSGFSTCEPTVIAATGLPRMTTSQDEGDAACNNANQIVYTSLANLQKYGPGTTACGNGHTIKALALQSCDYTGFSGSTDPLSLTCSGSYVAPSVSSAAVSGSYPAKRQLFIALPKVSVMAAKWGVGNGTGWTDQLGLTKAMDIINYMESTQGQQAMGAVGFVQISVPTKQPIPDADVDLNGGIGLTDIGQITGRWNQTSTISGSIRADVDNNGGVGLTDIGKITGQWGGTGFTAP
jgi:ABC-type phosphate transport system substrate-binding protein